MGLTVLLPQSLRDSLVVELDAYLEAFGSDPDPEAASAFVVEHLETFADERGYDDLIGALEDGGSLDGTLAEVLEGEMASNDEFEFTGEEIASLLERVCVIEWGDDETDDELPEDDDSEF